MQLKLRLPIQKREPIKVRLEEIYHQIGKLIPISKQREKMLALFGEKGLCGTA